MSLLARRHVLLAGAAVPGLGLGLARCSSGGASPSYDEAATRTHETLHSSVGSPASMLKLVRHATLAPSSHNVQCWKFSVEPRGIEIHPDLSGRCPAVGPDDHHRFVSLGCAAEKPRRD